MDLLTLLPADLFGGLLEVWLPFASIGRIDSAYCCSKREGMLATFSAILFSVHGIDRWYPARMVTWLLKRKVCVSVFKYKIRESGPCSSYLKFFGIHVTSIVQYQNHGTQTEKIMQIGHMCPHLVKFNGTWNMLGGTWYLANLQELVLRTTDYIYSGSGDVTWKAYTSNVIDNYTARSPWPHLRLLSVEGICENTTAVVQRMVLAACESLQCLVLKSGDQRFALPVTLIETIAHCRQLRSLGLRGVDDVAVHTIVTHSPLICNLDLSYNTTVTDTGILHLARGLRSLRSLCLCRCDSLTNVTLEYLQTYCTNTLRVLFLANGLMRGITAATIHAMIPHLHTYHYSVEAHHYVRDYGVTDVLIVSKEIRYLGLANIHAPELQVLAVLSDPNLSNTVSIINGLTSATLSTLLHNCPKLHTIYVSTSQQHRVMSELVQDLPQLTVTTKNQNYVYDLFGIHV